MLKQSLQTLVLLAVALGVFSCTPLAVPRAESPNDITVIETVESFNGREVLYIDDFSSSSSNWIVPTEYPGVSKVDYIDGEYVFKLKYDSWYTWRTAGKNFSNIHIDVTVVNQSVDGDHAFGIICNYGDDANYYFMGIGPDTYYAIAKSVNNVTTVMTDPDDNWVTSDKIKENAASYTLGAECVDGRLTLYVDGVVIDSVKDDDFTEGDVGLFVLTFEKPAAEIHFDDFVVTRP